MRLAVLTTGRQDWGILRSTCLAMRDDVVLLAGGMHNEPRFGSTVEQLVADGFAPERLRWAEHDDVQRQAGDALRLVGEALAKHWPDALLLVGDRFMRLADKFRSPHLWHQVDGQWKMRKTVWNP